jgi:hypothetical protein
MDDRSRIVSLLRYHTPNMIFIIGINGEGMITLTSAWTLGSRLEIASGP